MFYDLNVPLDAKDARALAALRATLKRLNYDCVAYNNVVVGKITPAQTNPYAEVIRAGTQDGHPFRELARLTVVVEDASQNYGLIATNPTLLSYDLLALQPTTEKMFQFCCQTAECDIVTFDLAKRIPFFVKGPPVGVAIERGIHFEITYSAAIRDATARRNLISNALNIVRVTKGRNVILSSEVASALELRGPYDVANLALMFGIDKGRAKACVSDAPRAVLLHARARRGARGVIEIAAVDAPLAPPATEAVELEDADMDEA